jgi:hypothetical protein
MASIVYLDVDDEITSAAARIRTAGERRLALVLPAGSRVSTSRINFRLLAREAASRGRELSIVAPEAGTRSLAASAGLPAFMSVVEYEDALKTAGPEAPVAHVAAAAGAATPAAEPTQVWPAAAAATSTSIRATTTARPGGGPHGVPPADTGHGPAGPGTNVRARSATRDTVTMPLPVADDPPSGRRLSRLLLALLSVLIVAFIASGVAAWQLLPTAVVTVHPKVEAVGPLQFTVRADPLEVSTDAANGVVPAQVVGFDLSVSQDFPATGKKITETKADGSVSWTNCDPTRAYTIPASTVAATDAGEKFVTTDAVFLPVAILSGNPPQISCQSRNVNVTASQPGPDGNVDAGAIDQVPTTYNSVVIRVTNPAATTGGTHVETKIVAQKDVDAAMAVLTKALRDQFTSQLADPANTPSGMTLFPATKSASSGDPTVDPESLVGQQGATFTLGMTGTGTATAVDPSLVTEVGMERARAAVSPDRSLVANSVNVALGTPHVDGSAVLYPVTAGASQVETLNASALRSMVRGLSVDEARDRLRNYGDATINVWPAWVSSITNYDFRLDLTVVSDVTIDQGGQSAGPSTSPSGPSGSPSAAPSGSAAPSTSRRPSAAPGSATPHPSAIPSTSPAPSGS